MQIKKIVTRAAFMFLASAFFISSGCSKSEKDNAKAPAQTQAPAAQQTFNSSAIIEDLKAKLGKKPNDPDVMLELGSAYFEARQYNDALIYYKKVLEKRPGDVALYNEIGLLYYYLKNPSDSIRYLDMGIKKDPYYQRIWLTKGFVLAGSNDIKGAQDAWERAVVINPASDVGKAAAEYIAVSRKQQNQAKAR